MRTKVQLRRIILLAALVGGAACAHSAALVHCDDQVYTADASRPWAQAVAFANGKITAAGSDQQVILNAGSI